MDTPDLRTADKTLLALTLRDARDYTISLLDHWVAWKDGVTVEGLRSPDPLHIPCLAIVNPPLWELGHVAWFMEYWCQRYRGNIEPCVFARKGRGRSAAALGQRDVGQPVVPKPISIDLLRQPPRLLSIVEDFA